MTTVKVHKSAERDCGEGWFLCFQWCTYHHENGEKEDGYRFIWKKPNGKLQPARGQARIPSIAIARELMDDAKRERWHEHNGY